MESLSTVACPKCHREFPDESLQDQGGLSACPSCKSIVELRVYPRLRKSISSSLKVDDLLSGEGDALCRFYPELKADTVCEECGCLLSKKAAVTWTNVDYCLPCLHLLRESKGRDEFLARRVIYDNTALGLILYLFPLSLFTAPLALYYLIRYRKASRGIVPRGKFRWLLATILSVVFSLGWLLLITLWIVAIVDSMA